MKADRTPKAIGGRYKILEPLGQGGVGSVFKAVDSRLGRIVAIKVFEKRQGDWRFSEHPQREAHAASRLSHPNIVSVFERGETEDHTFQVREFVEGSQLSAILAGKEPLHWEYAIELVRQVGSGLSAAHACGLVHRDVKPSNILVSRDGRVLLTDFGLSARTTDPAVTAIGTIVGTPAYMSPEQVRGKEVDARSDIFSLGAVLYELLTGQRPFTGGGSVTGVLSAIVNDPPERICQGNPSVPAAIEQVVLKALEKEPPQRYQTIDEFREALTEAKRTSGNEFSSMLGGRVIRETKLREPVVPLPRVEIESARRGFGNERLADAVQRRRHIEQLVSQAKEQIESAEFEAAKTRIRDALNLYPESSSAASLILGQAKTSGMTTERGKKRHKKQPGSEELESTERIDSAMLRPEAHTARLRAIWLWSLLFLAAVSLIFALFSLLKHIPQAWHGSSPHWFLLGLVVMSVSFCAMLALSLAVLRRLRTPLATGASTLRAEHDYVSEWTKDSAELSRSRDDDVTVETFPYNLPLPATQLLRNETSGMAWLLVLNGALRGRQFRLSAKTSIGRSSDYDVLLFDTNVSRQHAIIFLENGHFTIHDCATKFGTKVNGVLVEKRELRDRDEIQIGNTVMLFIQAVSSEDLTAEAKRRITEFDSVWEKLRAAARHG